jgi:hypothetical protein
VAPSGGANLDKRRALERNFRHVVGRLEKVVLFDNFKVRGGVGGAALGKPLAEQSFAAARRANEQNNFEALLDDFGAQFGNFGRVE